MIGRPKQFDKEDALERAMQVFWTKGYEAASVQDLLDGMGINRGSMYDTFGDKHCLFLKAVERYEQRVTARLVGILNASGSPLANIRKVLEITVDMAAAPECRGCLVTNTTMELAGRDPKAAKAIRSTFGSLEKAFRQSLERAIAAGELSSKSDTRALARFLTGAMQGLIVMGKASAGRAVLQDVMRVATSLLKR